MIGNLADYGSVALTWLDQAHGLQPANRVADGTATDSKHLRQLALRRKFVSWFHFVQDPLLEFVSHFLVELVPADGFEFGFSLRQHLAHWVPLRLFNWCVDEVIRPIA
jgi:hypothetical protein